MKTFDQHLAEVTNRAKPQARDWFPVIVGDTRAQHVIASVRSNSACATVFCDKEFQLKKPDGTEEKAYTFLAVRNDAENAEESEMLLYGSIGDDLFDRSGSFAATFAQALNSIPKEKRPVIRMHTKGGNVWDAFACGTHISERGNVTTKCDGIVASAGSVIFNCGAKRIMPKASMQMIHNTRAICPGTSKEMRAMAEELAVHDEVLAKTFSDRSGQSVKACRDMMDAETWMDGETAKKKGFCDELTDSPAIKNDFDFSQFRCVPDALRAVENQAGTAHADGRKDNKNMDKTKILELLRQNGIEVANEADEATLLAKLTELGAKAKASTAAPQNVVDLENRVKDISQKLANARRQSVTAEVEKLIGECRIPASQKEVCVENALKDEKHLDFLRALEPKLPGAAPMNTVEAPDIQVGASLAEISNAVKRYDEPFAAIVRGNNVPMKAVTNAAYTRAKMIEKHRAQMESVFNAAGENTVATELKRSVILQTIVRDFARRVLPLNAFSTAFFNVPLEGTDKVEVPYYDLDTTATRTWVAGTGYSVVGTTTTDKREISVTTRRFLDMAFTSQDIARQPFLNIQQLATLKAENLGAAVIDDVLSCITAANFGAAAITSGTDAFDSDDAAELVTACKLWPAEGRSLFLDTAYHVALIKDPSFKAAFANAVSVMKEGSIGPRLMGFDYVENPRIPGNSENLVGFAAHKSAILFASAPIAPVEEVRNAGTMYQMYVDPISGITIEYRRFGNNTLDQAMHIIESNYGYAVGNNYQSASKLGAIRRIVSA